MSNPLYVTWGNDKGLIVIRQAVAGLEQGRARKALRRAINHTGDKTFRVTVRSVAQVMGVPQGRLTERSGKRGHLIRKRLASDGDLQYQIIGTGGAIRIKEFKPKQLAKGWSFAPWGNRRRFKSAFFIGAGAKWGAGKLADGNFYVRAGKGRFPLHALWGPNVTKEMVKDHVVAAFHHTVDANLPSRVLHEIRWLTNGAFT